MDTATKTHDDGHTVVWTDPSTHARFGTVASQPGRARRVALRRYNLAGHATYVEDVIGSGRFRRLASDRQAASFAFDRSIHDLMHQPVDVADPFAQRDAIAAHLR